MCPAGIVRINKVRRSNSPILLQIVQSSLYCLTNSQTSIFKTNQNPQFIIANQFKLTMQYGIINRATRRQSGEGCNPPPLSTQRSPTALQTPLNCFGIGSWAYTDLLITCELNIRPTCPSPGAVRRIRTSLSLPHKA
jgi:hypothetical protein